MKMALQKITHTNLSIVNDRKYALVMKRGSYEEKISSIVRTLKDLGQKMDMLTKDYQKMTGTVITMRAGKANTEAVSELDLRLSELGRRQKELQLQF